MDGSSKDFIRFIKKTVGKNHNNKIKYFKVLKKVELVEIKKLYL